MFGVLVSACLVSTAMGIIVTDPPPTSTEYNYSYKVVDPRTGDTKSLYEKRTGGVVTGSYSVIDPDGTHRVVKYTADSRRGFKAVVHSEPLAPFHHTARNPYYFTDGSTRYLNPYYTPQSTHALYRGHSLPESYTMKPSSDQVEQKNSDEIGERQARFFTPSNEIQSEPAMTFKNGEYFAPEN